MKKIFLFILCCVSLLNCKTTQNVLNTEKDNVLNTEKDSDLIYHAENIENYYANLEYEPITKFRIIGEYKKELVIDIGEDPITVYGDLEYDDAANLFFEYMANNCKCKNKRTKR